MQVLLRLLAFAIAAVLLAGVIYLGMMSGSQPWIVPWFGIASAIGAPIGLSLLSYVFNAGTISSLRKIPQIDALVEEAESTEDRIVELKEARKDLVALIETEAHRQATLDRLERLEAEAGRLLGEFGALDTELATIGIHDEGAFARKAIEGLRDRVAARRRGDIVLEFGSRTFILERDLFARLPFGLGGA